MSDFCHQQLLRKMRRKYLGWTEGRTDGRTDRGKTVYPPPPSGSGGIIKKYIYEIGSRGNQLILYNGI